MTRPTVFRLVITLITVGIFTPLMAKDIGILMDRSRSVEQGNRDEAVELVNGLLGGGIEPRIRGKWMIQADGISSEDDPGQRELRQQELANIRALLAGEAGKGLAGERFRLFLGSFGNLDTVRNLESEAWAEVSGSTSAKITEWAKTVAPSDNETHFELARATAAARLGGAGEFYFFVISDGVEDLVNWPVSSYLDASKIKDPAALAKGDFRDLEKARILEAYNLKRISGSTVKIGGKTYPGYDDSARGTLASFKKNFAERLLCRITLKGPDIQSFFAGHPEKKVPVSVSIYSARPKQAVGLAFTTPADSSAGQPHPVSRSADRIGWTLDLPAGQRLEDYGLELFARRASDSAEMGVKKVSGSEGALFQWFPDLANGDYELRLTATGKGVSPVVTSAFINVKRDAPRLAFLGELAEADRKESARIFDPRRDRDILGYKVAWNWTSGDKEDPGPPSKLERSLSYVDDLDSTRKLETVTKLSPEEKSAVLSKLLTADESSESALPLGGTYRLRLTATWPDGTVATPAEAWFVLPPPNLMILRKTAESESEPRIVEKGELIKIGNWMDRWTKHHFSYDLSVMKKEGGEWVPLEGSSSEWPLKLEETSNGPCIRVASSFSEVMRYRVSFGPDDDAKRELVECPEAFGFVETKGFPLLPWILGGLILLTLGFFGWNLLRKR